MQGAAHWLTGLVVLGGGTAVWTAVLALGGRRHRRLAQREVMCPQHHEKLDCTLSMSTISGACIDVERCSHFDPPERVSCERNCIREINAGERAST